MSDARKGAKSVPPRTLDGLPAGARLWIFPSTAPLGAREAERLLAATDSFLAGWAAHGRPLASGRELLEGRFLAIGVDEGSVGASGCSIDALSHRLGELGAELGSSFVDHSKVWYREPSGAVACVSRGEFRSLARGGELGPETVVFDTTYSRLGDLRTRGLGVPAASSWHARLAGDAWRPPS